MTPKESSILTKRALILIKSNGSGCRYQFAWRHDDSKFRISMTNRVVPRVEKKAKSMVLSPLLFTNSTNS